MVVMFLAVPFRCKVPWIPTQDYKCHVPCIKRGPDCFPSQPQYVHVTNCMAGNQDGISLLQLVLGIFFSSIIYEYIITAGFYPCVRLAYDGCMPTSWQTVSGIPHLQELRIIKLLFKLSFNCRIKWKICLLLTDFISHIKTNCMRRIFQTETRGP